ncbi:hypothetical protein H4W33_004700 [Kibdelosporangium phytohabitans]|nr:hypothetical protein [Kibdelosporangium phytohabitans]
MWIEQLRRRHKHSARRIVLELATVDITVSVRPRLPLGDPSLRGHQSVLSALLVPGSFPVSISAWRRQL